MCLVKVYFCAKAAPHSPQTLDGNRVRFLESCVDAGAFPLAPSPVAIRVAGPVTAGLNAVAKVRLSVGVAKGRLGGGGTGDGVRLSVGVAKGGVRRVVGVAKGPMGGGVLGNNMSALADPMSGKG